MSGFFGRNWGFETLVNIRQMRFPPFIQVHLKQAYFTLCCALGIVAFGVCLHFIWGIGGLHLAVGAIGGLAFQFLKPPQKLLNFALLLFVGYIVVDCRGINERACRGDFDFLEHAFKLFVTFTTFLVFPVINMLVTQ